VRFTMTDDAGVEPRRAHWLLPAFSSDASRALRDPNLTAEERERIMDEYLEGVAYDVLSGWSMPLRELLSLRRSS